MEDDYKALTLDTNIFSNKKYNFSGGLLARVKQFNGSPTKFLLSDIVTREVLKHIKLEYENCRNELNSKLKNCSRKKLIGQQSYESISEILNLEKDPLELAESNLNNYLMATGATVIPSSLSDMNRLTKMYFDFDPPFENNELKKKEFPDAIALLSLEQWAINNETKILAVTNDKGWAKFAENSDWIDVMQDFDKALELLHAHKEFFLTEIINNFLSRVSNDKDSEYLSLIKDKLKSEVDDTLFHADFNSHYFVEIEWLEVSFDSFEFLEMEEDCFDFSIIEIDEKILTINLNLTMTLKINGECSVSIYDTVDKDYVSLNSSEIDFRQTDNVAVILTLRANQIDRNADFGIEEIEEIEVEQLSGIVEIGSIDPDFGFDSDLLDFRE